MATQVENPVTRPRKVATKTLYRVKPRGFCAGVVRAIEIVSLSLDVYGAPIYVLHEIVHNRYVVEDLAAKGAVFVDCLSEVPAGQTVIFSAHGVSPEVRAEADSRRLRVIDATCPLVTKVHLEAIRYAREKKTIILIGDRDHDELVGTFGEAPGSTIIITSVEEAAKLEVNDPGNLVYLTQTTLSQYDTAEIIGRLRERFPSVQGPPADDICYATQNRQSAIERLAREVDLVLVVGSFNSSNSNRLVEVASRVGVRAALIEDEDSIDTSWLEGAEAIGLTAGASAPEFLVERITQRLAELGFEHIEEVELIQEDVRFSLPVSLVSRTETPGSARF